MLILGIRCSTNDYTYAVLQGDIDEPVLAETQTIPCPANYSQPEKLKWLLDELNSLNLVVWYENPDVAAERLPSSPSAIAPSARHRAAPRASRLEAGGPSGLAPGAARCRAEGRTDPKPAAVMSTEHADQMARFGSVYGMQRHAAIQRDQPTVLMDRQGEEIEIGQLARPQHMVPVEGSGRDEA